MYQLESQSVSKRFSDRPVQEQPTYRIENLFPTALTYDELLSIALGVNEVEIAESLKQLVAEFKMLARVPKQRITKIKGLGPKTYQRICAIVELGHREHGYFNTEKTTLNGPQTVVDMVKYEMSALDHEELWVVLLDTRNRVNRIVKLYKGALNVSTVRVAEVFKEAIAEMAKSIILVHNHPSGDHHPSPDDVALTRVIKDVGSQLDIELLDHIVIGHGGYTSMKGAGLAFK